MKTYDLITACLADNTEIVY